jgi:hypothetical protein
MPGGRRIPERLATLESEVAALTTSSPVDPSAQASEKLDANNIASAFQREIFRINEGRLASTDTQAGILIAAAVTVATFTGGLVKSGDVDIAGLVSTGALAVVVTILALHARRERPWALSRSAAAEMEQTGVLAGKKVGQMYDSARDESFGDPVAAARAEFAAWYALSASIKARRRVKTAWYVIAVVGLLVEVAAATYTALSLNPSP